IKAKRAGKEPPHAPEGRPSNVINLMDALRRSAQAERRRPATRASARKTHGHRKRSTTRRKVRKAG
ncbi:MAG: Ku protein, partial [Rhizobiales bacterium]|nr:Ku protein [Hyphomicrobiales bacterium]